jgi:hypothetical protein
VLDDRQGRLELDLYLRIWEALHPDAPVDVLRGLNANHSERTELPGPRTKGQAA